jgi:hypothetical protein
MKNVQQYDELLMKKKIKN